MTGPRVVLPEPQAGGDIIGAVNRALQALYAAVEAVLLDHEHQLDGDDVDPNLAELAYVYEQLTGWTVAAESVAGVEDVELPGERIEP